MALYSYGPRSRSAQAQHTFGATGTAELEKGLLFFFLLLFFVGRHQTRCEAGFPTVPRACSVHPNAHDHEPTTS